jgi:hypothetical protein
LKYQIKSTKLQAPKYKQAPKPEIQMTETGTTGPFLSFLFLALEFVCDLVLVFWNFPAPPTPAPA